MVCPRERRAFQTHKRNIIVAPASSAYKHSLKELFSAPGLASQIKVRASAVSLATKPKSPGCPLLGLETLPRIPCATWKQLSIG